MTQNGLKWILNTTLKSVTFGRRDLQTDTAFIVKDSYSRCGRNNCIKAFKSTFPGEEYKVRKRIFFEHFNLICKYRFRQTACMMYLMIAAISLTSSMRIFQEDTMTITLRNRQKVFYQRGISLNFNSQSRRALWPRQPPIPSAV